MLARYQVRPKLSLIVLAVAAVSLAVVGLVIAAGGSEAKGQRKRLQISDAPKNAEQLLAIQKTMAAEADRPGVEPTRDVVITGQIGGMPNVWPELHPTFPWYEKQASFFLIDNQVAAQFAGHAHSHGSHASGCAFCQNLAVKNANAIAVVNLVDEKGEIIRVDSRELLGLEENQKVTVHGKARLLGGSMLVIDADGVFVNR